MYGLISPSGRVAALCNANMASLYDANGDLLGERSIIAVTALFRSFGDTFKCIKTKKDELVYKLKVECDKEESLDLLLTILDRQIEDDSKLEIALFLETLMHQEIVIDHLRCCMYSSPLPNDFMLSVEVCDAIMGRFPLLYSFLFDLIGNQIKISKVFDFWNKFVSEKVSEEHKGLIDGVYAKSKIAFLYSFGGDRNSASKIKFYFYQRLKLVPNHREIISNFFSQLDFDSIPVRQDWQIKPEDDEFEQDEYKKQKDDSHQWKVQVQGQINTIKELLSKNNVSKAKFYADSLVKQQVRGGYSSFASKSLGLLAEFAKTNQFFDLMLLWALQSTEVDPTDERAWSQLADAYLLVENFEKAYITYDRCFGFAGLKSYSLAGKARIYRAKHDYESALHYIEQAFDYDVDPVHGAIKAEILADMGRYEEAESLYVSLVKENPDNLKFKCGLAAAMEEQNKFSESENLYRETIKYWSTDQVPHTGLGCLLAKQGRFKEAFKYLDHGIELSQTLASSSVSINAKAKALRMAGKYKVAEKILSDAIEKNQRSIELKIGMLEVLIARGDFNRALQLCNEYQENASEIVFDTMSRMRALVLKKNGQLKSALEIVSHLSMKHPKWLQVLCDKADLLRGFGEVDAARNTYCAILDFHKGYRRAQIGIRLLDGLSKRDNIEVIRPVNRNLITFEDWEDLHLDGLLLLANRRYKDAQELLKVGKTSPFQMVADAALIPECVAQVGLGACNKVLTKINALTSDDANVQRIIIYSHLGEIEKAEQLASKVDMSNEFVQHIVPFIKQQYSLASVATNDAIYQVLDEHVNCMLRAA